MFSPFCGLLEFRFCVGFSSLLSLDLSSVSSLFCLSFPYLLVVSSAPPHTPCSSTFVSLSYGLILAVVITPVWLLWSRAAAPPHRKDSAEVVLVRMPPGRLLWRFSRHILLGGGPAADPGLAGGIRYPFWAWDTPGAAGECCWGEGCLALTPGPVASASWPWIRGQKWTDGWIVWSEFILWPSIQSGYAF